MRLKFFAPNVGFLRKGDGEGPFFNMTGAIRDLTRPFTDARSPQALGRQFGTIDESLELQPSSLRMAGVKANEICEAAIGARDNALFAHDIGKPLEPLRDKFRMLDGVGLSVNHTDDQRLIVRQFHVLPDRPLVFMPGVCRFDIDELRPRLQDELDNGPERDVLVVRAAIVAPADVIANSSCTIGLTAPTCPTPRASACATALNRLTAHQPARRSSVAA
jgi:hypothetical protein